MLAYFMKNQSTPQVMLSKVLTYYLTSLNSYITSCQGHILVRSLYKYVANIYESEKKWRIKYWGLRSWWLVRSFENANRSCYGRVEMGLGHSKVKVDAVYPMSLGRVESTNKPWRFEKDILGTKYCGQTWWVRERTESHNQWKLERMDCKIYPG